jgi:formylglycine-generating enzyme required for sulfatase activity
MEHHLSLSSRIRPLVAAALLILVGILPLLLAQEPAPKRYAVLVGINKYEHDKLPALQYAESDVTDLRVLLQKAGYEVTLLTGSSRDDGLRPTRENVEKHLRTVLRKCRAGDTVLIGLSGHGLQFEGQEDCFYCPVDARPFKDETSSLVSLGKVYAEMQKSFAGMKVLLVDACRDDPDAGRGSRGINADSAPRPPQGVAALFSCRAGERAYEHKDYGHGVFFHHVLKGLEGEAKDSDREVTFAGLAAYVSRRVARDVPRLIGSGAKQSPNLKADYSTEPVLLALRDVPRESDTDRVERPRPKPIDCTGVDELSKEEVRRAQEAWARYLGRQVEETIDLANGVKMTFVLIPPGRFRMGSPAEEQGYVTNTCFDGKRPDWLDREKQHQVTLTEPFDLAKTELTQAQYEALTGENPSKFKGADKPVEQVSWEDARAYAEKLTKRREDKHVYRLPSESEWEYSCRGGRSSSKPFGIGNGRSLSSREANFNGGYPYGGADKGPYVETTCAVASYATNALGLHDMHGNVWEWCADWYGAYPERDVTDPRGPAEGSDRVIRGGSWYFHGWSCRAAHRGIEPGYRSSDLGFRLARSVPSGNK